MAQKSVVVAHPLSISEHPNKIFIINNFIFLRSLFTLQNAFRSPMELRLSGLSFALHPPPEEGQDDCGQGGEDRLDHVFPPFILAKRLEMKVRT